MEEALSFLRAFEEIIYLLLGLGGLFYIRKFVLAWQELQGAGFGLERETAQSRLNSSASMLVLLLTMAVAEFVLVSFVAPSFPGATPLFTPTIDLLATATTTLPAETEASTTQVPGELPVTLTPAPVFFAQDGCQEGQVEITSPALATEVSGVVEIRGTANIENFGFYMFEMKRPEETAWLTLQAGNRPVVDGSLGFWDTRRLATGEYQLGLVVVDNQAQALPPCVVQVRVVPLPEETAMP